MFGPGRWHDEFLGGFNLFSFFSLSSLLLDRVTGSAEVFLNMGRGSLSPWKVNLGNR